MEQSKTNFFLFSPFFGIWRDGTDVSFPELSGSQHASLVAISTTKLKKYIYIYKREREATSTEEKKEK